MKKYKHTYSCKKCRYIAVVSSKEELESERKRHAEFCDSELKMSEGNCVKIAYAISERKRNFLFCYARVKGKIDGQSFIHVWNECEGFFKKKNGKLKIITKEESGKRIINFVFDYSNNNKIVLEAEKYYKLVGIDEEYVKRLNFNELDKKVSEAKKEGHSLFYWLYD